MQQFNQGKGIEESNMPIPGTQLCDATGRQAKVVAIQAGKHELNAAIRLDDGHEMIVPVSALALQPDGTYRLPFAFVQPVEDRLQTVPVMQEQLEVGKQRIDTGKGVRINKTVIERKQIVDPVLMQDDLEVERVACGQMVNAAALPIAHYDGDTLVVPVLEEVLVVEKRMRLKEEVRITRRQQEVRAPQTVVLKEEQVSVERFNEGGNDATQVPHSDS